MEVRLVAEGERPLLRNRDHPGAHIDAQQLDPRRGVFEVATCANGNLEHHSARLRTRPGPPAREQHPLEEFDVLLVPRGKLVPNAPDSLGLACHSGHRHPFSRGMTSTSTPS